MLQDPSKKYHPHSPIALTDRQWPDRQITHSPRWLSTDLRDGNQALAEPMDVSRKREFWNLLIQCGFKEIEVAFPAASETDFQFVRMLIEDNLIPDDVTIQVLTQARSDLITRTFEALEGAKQATVHMYNATAPLFREYVFGLSKEAIIQLAVNGTRKVYEACLLRPETAWCYEYSPETFCFTEPDFALQICEAVADIWQPSDSRPMIINLPATVEVNTPNVYADQIEYFCRHFSRREHVCISVHPHNDRGSGIAAAELALLAGADRIEGCLFGNGERTGNVCLVTLAMNLYSQGISPRLDFSNIRHVAEQVEKLNQLPVHPRHPYAGKLAFTAFSGSHQDAIKKGFHAREKRKTAQWEIPYLPVDPADLGCTYEAVIRLNSQSGKSGAAWMLEQNHGLMLPRELQLDFSRHVQIRTDKDGREMTLAMLWGLFRNLYGPYTDAPCQLINYRSESFTEGKLHLIFRIQQGRDIIPLEGIGNGLLSAAAAALNGHFDVDLSIDSYHEHTLGAHSESRSAAYIRSTFSEGARRWGVGIDNDISRASLQALLNTLPLNQ